MTIEELYAYLNNFDCIDYEIEVRNKDGKFSTNINAQLCTNRENLEVIRIDAD